ncbi:monoacylglycerol lipase ABHD6-like [Pseudonaja textilis]|uniref:monoacylglycerol lipase ABHD6-like n=1 Tax=Pseudonaja textilis TaxID=8673 RepID=UPI000EA8BD1B|nr:monoacylglycerol lipase ABHD6-like [Pseudonaja textilis]
MDHNMIRTIMHTAMALLSFFISKFSVLPSLLFRIMIWTKRLKMGVKVKYLYNEGYQFSYFTRGEPGSRPSVLMLHGFSLNKDMWLNTIEVFPKDLHLVCLDLPGHGGTTCLLGESYTAVAQAKRVHQFVQCAGLNHKPFHLVGMSMGGMVAGVYAALYPAHISSLALFCPAGVRYLTDSEFFAQLHELIFSKGSVENAIIPVTEEHLENFQGFLDLTSSESRYSLHENMRKIKAPTQIIWGKEDKVFDSSGAAVLAAAIPNSQVHWLEKCGHFITLERPRTSAKLLLEFYKSVCGSAKQKKVA